MTEKQRIDSFLSQKNIALVGFSRNPKKFGAEVFNTLKSKGYNVFPVNPAGGTTTEGQEIFADISIVPNEVMVALIITKPEHTNTEVKKALEKGMTHVWVQQMSQNAETIKLLEDSGVIYVVKRCIFMHANPTGFHKFHQTLAKLFGLLPK